MKVQLLLVFCLLIFATVFIQWFVLPTTPKSTVEILQTMTSKKPSQFYEEILNIPEFNAHLHSDGCSGGMSVAYSKLTQLHDRYGQQLPWRSCCVEHDKSYYYGGSKEKKQLADHSLNQCVTSIVGKDDLGPVLGLIMEKTVNIGGLPYFPSSYRWGYGEDFRVKVNDSIN